MHLDTMMQPLECSKHSAKECEVPSALEPFDSELEGALRRWWEWTCSMPSIPPSYQGPYHSYAESLLDCAYKDHYDIMIALGPRQKSDMLCMKMSIYAALTFE